MAKNQDDKGNNSNEDVKDKLNINNSNDDGNYKKTVMTTFVQLNFSVSRVTDKKSC